MFDFYLQSHPIIKSLTASTAFLSIYLTFFNLFQPILYRVPCRKAAIISAKMTANKATAIIILDSPDKWEDWELKFKAQVVSYNLVNQIFDDEAFLNKSIKPARPIYRMVAATRA